VKNLKQLQYDFKTLEKISDINDARFYMVAGDLTEHGKEENLWLLKQETGKMRRPFHAGFGGQSITAKENITIGVRKSDECSIKIRSRPNIKH